MADDAGAAGDAAGAVKPVRVFVSYSHDSQEHKDRVLALADKLCADGLDCELDQYNPFPSEGWYRWSKNQIADSDLVLLICTETYCRRLSGKEAAGTGAGATLEGFVSFQELVQAGMVNKRFIPVVFDRHDHVHIPKEFKNYNIFCVTFNDGCDYDALHAFLTGRNVCPKPPIGPVPPVRLKPRPAFTSQPAPSPARPWFVPHADNPFFTGRQDELDILHAALSGGGRAAICQAISGLGGIGKTQTAVRYCYDRRDDYTAIFWLRAQSPDTLAADVAVVARELGLAEAGAGEQAVTTRAVQLWLRTCTDWLLVLDNVDTEAMRDACRDFLPTGLQGGAVLITSRLEDLTELNVAAPLRLPVLPEEEAIAFLFRRTGRQQADQTEAEMDAVRLLARDLGCLPLALEQAAAYCKECRLSFADYRTRLKEAGVALLDKGKVKAGTYEKTIATTWQLSMAEVARECPAAVTVLQICSMLAAEAIPLEVISKGGPEMGPDVATAIEEDGVESVLAPLAKYSLIDWEVGADDFSMHRLVQCVTRENMGEEKKKECAEQAVTALATAFPDVEYANWPLCERLTPHVLTCQGWIRNYIVTTENAGRLCNNAGYYLNARAQLTKTESLYRLALEIAVTVLGKDHQNVAICLNNLAELLRTQGRLNEAESLSHQALTILEKSVGPDHPSVATTLNNFASLLLDNGKPNEAKLLYYRSLAIKERALGPNHPSVATSLNNIAGLLDDQGDIYEADKLQRRSLAIREKFLELEHPDVAISLNNLALLQIKQGKLGDAELLLRRSLAIREKALGSEHPNVAISLKNLALLLRDTNRADEAAPLLARAKAIRKAHAQRNNLPYNEDDA